MVQVEKNNKANKRLVYIKRQGTNRHILCPSTSGGNFCEGSSKKGMMGSE